VFQDHYFGPAIGSLLGEIIVVPVSEFTSLGTCSDRRRGTPLQFLASSLESSCFFRGTFFLFPRLLFLRFLCVVSTLELCLATLGLDKGMYYYLDPNDGSRSTVLAR
jgi:hypothetical protein